MSSKTNIRPVAVNNESGRRMYMSDDGYQDQVRKPTDKFFNNQVRRRHSENKKPYTMDDYGEMEYIAFPPWGFNLGWPRFPDSPIINGEGTAPADNPYDYYGSPDDLPDNPFPLLGCAFLSDFVPLAIFPGETATAKLQPRDDRIISIHTIGPCHVILTPIACVRSIPDPLSQAFHCTAVIRAEEDFTGYGMDDTGMIDCVLVLGTESGGSCSARAKILACDDENVPAWDDVNSATAIDRNQNVSVFVTGGTGPYTWSVSGTGFSITAKTTVPTNTLVADGTACGNATITVTDACGNNCGGVVMCAEGEWSTSGTEIGMSGECPCTGPPDEGTVYDGAIWCTGWRVTEQKHWAYRCGGYVGSCTCQSADSPWKWTPCITGYSCPTSDPPHSCQVAVETDICCSCLFNSDEWQLSYWLYYDYRAKFQWIC